MFYGIPWKPFHRPECVCKQCVNWVKNELNKDISEAEKTVMKEYLTEKITRKR